uniref:Excinuclease ABC subunit C n=1 Tax=Ascaris lumbricoides TaxID=6252 RepID=A0A0M3IU67_ASCLU
MKGVLTRKKLDTLVEIFEIYKILYYRVKSKSNNVAVQRRENLNEFHTRKTKKNYFFLAQYQ